MGAGGAAPMGAPVGPAPAAVPWGAAPMGAPVGLQPGIAPPPGRAGAILDTMAGAIPAGALTALCPMCSEPMAAEGDLCVTCLESCL